uniref:Galectin n=1 Tax=Anopheles farauti TaxID=69004 RepID=A0A182Q1K9_9DIPT
MSKRPFTARFPTFPANGDEVIIRAKLKDDARKFSVNFCLPPPEMLQDGAPKPYIAYHFKTMYDANGASCVVHNWKNVQWQEELVVDNNWHVDRSKTFRVVFRLHEDSIKVFVGCVDHPPDYEFPLQMPLDQIDTLELWDDVERVDEISFRVLNNTADTRTYRS